MWYRNASRKELLELVLSPFGEREGRVTDFQTSLPPSYGGKDSILLGWNENPVSSQPALPCLAVANDGDIHDLLALVNASPQSPSPFTAFCRFVSKSDFLAYQESPTLDFVMPDLASLIALSYAESLVHADGQLRLVDISPAICERTFSLTWAKAVTAQVPFSQLGKLAEAWLDVFISTGDPNRIGRAEETISALLPVLRVITELQLGVRRDDSAEAMYCQALLEGSKELQELAWQRLSIDLPAAPTLKIISEATREERGQVFQQAARIGASPFILALLAAQISPGTLDHIEIALAQQDSRVVFWYAALAAFAKPGTFMVSQGARGLRLRRLVARDVKFEHYPKCDLSYAEFKVLARSGLEQLAKGLEHAGEISIELVPLVTSTFRFPLKGGRSPEAHDKERRFALDRQKDRLLAIARMIEDVVYSQQMDIESPDNRPRKGGNRGNK